MGHSLFSPSASKRWISCPASIALSAQFPQPYTSSDAADEGTAAHSLVEWSLEHKKLPSVRLGDKIHVNGKDYLVNQEMVECAEDYVLEILKYGSKKFNPNIRDTYQIEQRVSLAWLGLDKCWGTSDCNLPDHANRTLHIFDFKYGKYSPVVAENNPQGMIYGLGALGLYNVEDFDNVHIHIIQPRGITGVTDWVISVEDLLAWCKGTLIPAYENALSDNPIFHASASNCQYCPASGVCVQVAKQLNDLIEVDIMNVPAKEDVKLPKVEHLSLEQISRIVTHRKSIEKFFKEVEEKALGMAMSGETIPELKMVRGRKGTRIWTDSEVAKSAFAKYGDEVIETKLLSPAQIEKVISPEDAQLIANLVTQNEGKIELAHVSDKRKPIELKRDENVNEMLAEYGEVME